MCVAGSARVDAQGTVTDVLEVQAMTSGSFQLRCGVLVVGTVVSELLRRFRRYLAPSVRCEYSVPGAAVTAHADRFRLSQLLGNAMRCVCARVCVLVSFPLCLAAV